MPIDERLDHDDLSGLTITTSFELAELEEIMDGFDAKEIAEREDRDRLDRRGYLVASPR